MGSERRETTLAVRVPGKPREGAECEDGPRNLGTLGSQEIWTRGDRRGVVKGRRQAAMKWVSGALREREIRDVISVL